MFFFKKNLTSCWKYCTVHLLAGDWFFMDYSPHWRSPLFALGCFAQLLTSLFCISNPSSVVQRNSCGLLSHGFQRHWDFALNIYTELFLYVWVPCAKRNSAVIPELHVEHSWQPRPRCDSCCVPWPGKGEIHFYPFCWSYGEISFFFFSLFFFLKTTLKIKQKWS